MIHKWYYKAMTNLIPSIFVLTLFTFGCSQNTNDKNVLSKKADGSDTIEYKGLQGTWIHHDKDGFVLIDIKDSSNILFYGYAYIKDPIDTIAINRHGYYKSKSTMGYWDSSSIWISTDQARLDYKIKGDTLIEFDKMGEQRRFIKVYTGEEKAFKQFNSANFKGVITHMTKVGETEFFVLDNIDWQYSFTSISSNGTNNKTFGDVAKVGDSVIKAAYADTLTLYKKDIQQYLKFAFVRR